MLLLWWSRYPWQSQAQFGLKFEPVQPAAWLGPIGSAFAMRFVNCWRRTGHSGTSWRLFRPKSRPQSRPLPAAFAKEHILSIQQLHDYVDSKGTSHGIVWNWCICIRWLNICHNFSYQKSKQQFSRSHRQNFSDIAVGSHVRTMQGRTVCSQKSVSATCVRDMCIGQEFVLEWTSEAKTAINEFFQAKVGLGLM